MAEKQDLNVTDASNTGRFPENQAPSTVNNGARALEGLIARHYYDTDFSVAATLSGSVIQMTANRTSLTLTGTTSNYFANAIMAFTNGATANPSPCSVNINGIGPISLRDAAGATLGPSVIPANSRAMILKDGTNDYWRLLLPHDTWVLIDEQTASSSASLDFTTGIGAGFQLYKFVLVDIVPATDTASLYLRTDANAGASFDASASDYSYSRRNLLAGSTTTDRTGTAAQIELAENLGSAAGESYSGTVTLFNPAGTNYTSVLFELQGGDASGVPSNSFGGGSRLSAAAIDAVQFIMSSGNIASGTIRLYGLRG